MANGIESLVGPDPWKILKKYLKRRLSDKPKGREIPLRPEAVGTGTENYVASLAALVRGPVGIMYTPKNPADMYGTSGRKSTGLMLALGESFRDPDKFVDLTERPGAWDSDSEYSESPVALSVHGGGRFSPLPTPPEEEILEMLAPYTYGLSRAKGGGRSESFLGDPDNPPREPRGESATAMGHESVRQEGPPTSHTFKMTDETYPWGNLIYEDEHGHSRSYSPPDKGDDWDWGERSVAAHEFGHGFDWRNILSEEQEDMLRDVGGDFYDRRMFNIDGTPKERNFLQKIGDLIDYRTRFLSVGKSGVGRERLATQFAKAIEPLQISLDPDRQFEARAMVNTPELKMLVGELLKHEVYRDHPWNVAGAMEASLER